MRCIYTFVFIKELTLLFASAILTAVRTLIRVLIDSLSDELHISHGASVCLSRKFGYTKHYSCMWGTRSLTIIWFVLIMFYMTSSVGPVQGPFTSRKPTVPSYSLHWLLEVWQKLFFNQKTWFKCVIISPKVHTAYQLYSYVRIHKRKLWTFALFKFDFKLIIPRLSHSM